MFTASRAHLFEIMEIYDTALGLYDWQGPLLGAKSGIIRRLKALYLEQLIGERGPLTTPLDTTLQRIDILPLVNFGVTAVKRGTTIQLPGL